MAEAKKKTAKKASGKSRKTLRTEGRKKRSEKLKDKEAHKAHHEGKSKRATEKKAAFRKKLRGKK